jgi:hypothetical protein
VAKWVAACDQPFIAVMREEFCEMLEYAHHHSPNTLKIPSPDSVKGKIVKMSDEMVKELKTIFKVCCGPPLISMNSQISQENKSNFVLSLDAWTSSNGYAFLAIVVHYIGNDGKLGLSLANSLSISINHA